MSDNSTGLVYNASAVVMEWVRQNLRGCERGWSNQTSTAIGVVHKGQIIAGVVYHNWAPEAGVVELSIYASSPRWATRKNIFQLLYYPFIDMQCQMVVTRSSAQNDRNVKMMRKLGFNELSLKRLFGRHENGIIFSLTDDDWKSGRFFLRLENGQTKSTETG